MTDEEIKELATQFLPLLTEGIPEGSKDDRLSFLIQFGREVAHKTSCWAHKIAMNAVSEIGERPYCDR